MEIEIANVRIETDNVGTIVSVDNEEHHADSELTLTDWLLAQILKGCPRKIKAVYSWGEWIGEPSLSGCVTRAYPLSVVEDIPPANPRS
jgi:hypothetical protein